MRSALIVGASGLVGGQCLKACLATEYYTRVAALVRKPLETVHEKLDQHFVNFESLHKFAHLVKADDIFCTLGTTIRKAGSQAAFEKVDYSYPVEIAKLAIANGAKQFLIVTSVGASKTSSVFYSRIKGRVEDTVTSLHFGSLRIFRPSFLLGERHEKRLGESVAIPLVRFISPLLIGSLRKYRGIDSGVVAETMVHVAGQEKQGIHIYESDGIQKIYDEEVRQ